MPIRSGSTDQATPIEHDENLVIIRFHGRRKFE